MILTAVLLFALAQSVDPTITVIDYISRGGFIALLLVIMWGGVKRWWVFGWQYEECREEAREWKDVALRSQHIANTSASIGEKLIDREAK